MCVTKYNSFHDGHCILKGELRRFVLTVKQDLIVGTLLTTA